MAFSDSEARARFGTARVGRLGTADLNGQPHLVPVTFVLVADRLAIAIDKKPKSTHNLKRLRNIADNSRVSVLVDHYDDDWSALWWVRIDGVARILEEQESRAPWIRALQDKYEQYLIDEPDGPVIEVTVAHWSSWAYSL